MTGYRVLIIHSIALGAQIGRISRFRRNAECLAVSIAPAYNRSMSFSRLTWLIALIAALALPFQAVAGLAMGIGAAVGGGQTAMQAAADDAAAMPEDCPMHKQTPAADGCSHCGLCHLGSSLIYSGHAASNALAAPASYTAANEATPASHISEPPLHPPKRPV